MSSPAFALPNLQSRVPVHFGQGPGLSSYSLGQQAGTETATLNVNSLPAHTHAVTHTASTAAATSATPTVGTVLAQAQGEDSGGSPVTVRVYGPATATVSLPGGNTGIAGGSQPFEILQPIWR